MKLRTRNILLMFGLALVLIFAWIGLAGPMLLSVHHGPMSVNPRIAVWNPIRNRAPERYGSELLAKIQSDDCETSVSALEISEQEKTTACKKQSYDPIRSDCNLNERIDTPSSVWLLFRCPYKRTTEMRAEVALTLARQGSGWSLKSYERIY